MRERVLAGCTSAGNCPGVTVLASGEVAATGALPDGSEVTVTLPAAVFDEAARAWLGRRRWFRRLGFHAEAVGWAIAGFTVATVVQDFTGSAGWGDVAGLPVVILGVFGSSWWRRRAGERDA